MDQVTKKYIYLSGAKSNDPLSHCLRYKRIQVH